MESNRSGAPNYESKIKYITKTSSSVERKFENKTAVSYDKIDVEKYQGNVPRSDIIYAKIIRQETKEKSCISSEETKTAE